MSRVEMAGGWSQVLDAEVGLGLKELFKDHLGPEILGDAQRFVPVDTGRLLKSLDAQVRDDSRLPVLEVGSFPDGEGEVAYAAATELGFHGEETVRAHTRNGHPVREHTRHANTPEQSYLRPSLYQERDS
jgi:hypothetical protein